MTILTLMPQIQREFSSSLKGTSYIKHLTTVTNTSYLIIKVNSLSNPLHFAALISSTQLTVLSYRTQVSARMLNWRNPKSHSGSSYPDPTECIFTNMSLINYYYTLDYHMIPNPKLKKIRLSRRVGKKQKKLQIWSNT